MRFLTLAEYLIALFYDNVRNYVMIILKGRHPAFVVSVSQTYSCKLTYYQTYWEEYYLYSVGWYFTMFLLLLSEL